MLTEEINTDELCCMCDERSTSDEVVCDECMYTIAQQHMQKHGKL